jgi:sugar O-acyltransferase (sialic acid O-acetyltransferase NeuD family)
MNSPASATESTSLIVFGAGGHGRVVADAALLGKRWAHIVASDRNPQRCHGELLPGIDLLRVQGLDVLPHRIHIAIGNNLWREREATAWGHSRLTSLIHPAAQVSPFSVVGDGCFAAACAVIAPSARVGVCVIVNHGAVIDHDAFVGAFSHIAPNAILGGEVKIGQRVLIGSGAVVLPGMTIADDVIVGAGAVVRTHLMAAGIYAGAPARKIK